MHTKYAPYLLVHVCAFVYVHICVYVEVVFPEEKIHVRKSAVRAAAASGSGPNQAGATNRRQNVTPLLSEKLRPG